MAVDRSSFRFDPFDFAVHADPYPFYRTLRRDYPAYYSEDARCWVLSRHADVVAAMLQPAVFSSAAGNVINDSPEKIGRTVGSADPPRHTRLRALVNDAFSRRAIAGEPDRIRAETVRLMAPLQGAGAFDLVRDVTAPLAGAVMATLLGMEGTDLGQFKRLLDVSLYRDPVTRERTAEGTQAQADLLALVAEGVARKRERPGNDLVSNLIAARLDGEALSSDEVLWMSRAILGAGFESTSSFLANGSLALLRHDAQRALLTAEPALIDAAIEEMLRFETPAQRFARVLARDHELHGQTMRTGTKVMVLYGSANRDEAVFAEPDRFDIMRRPTRHLGFGHGIHFCAGAALARMVARIYFAELPRLLPKLRLLQADRVEWVHSPTFRSLAALPAIAN
jgi:cytochrome P450